MRSLIGAPGVAGCVAWQDAVQEAPGGCRLLLEASPGARAAAFPDGYNPWRGRIGVRVRAPAQEGRANRELLALVAECFGVAASAVRLEAGQADARKAVFVPLGRPAVLERLAARMAP